MAVFKVQAVNPETGKEQWVQVEAFTPDMAEDEVHGRGLLVGQVSVADEAPPGQPVFEVEPPAGRVPPAAEAVFAGLDEAMPGPRVPPPPQAGVGLPAAGGRSSPMLGLVFASAMLRVAGVFLLLLGAAGGFAVYGRLGGAAGLPASGAWALGALFAGALLGVFFYGLGEALRCLGALASDLRSRRSGP